jgi:hypothetical protein
MSAQDERDARKNIEVWAMARGVLEGCEGAIVFKILTGSRYDMLNIRFGNE